MVAGQALLEDGVGLTRSAPPTRGAATAFGAFLAAALLAAPFLLAFSVMAVPFALRMLPDAL